MENISIDTLGLIGKLAFAMFLGILLGSERSIAHKIAGMRTYGLVAMGSTLFTIVSILATGGYDSPSFLDSTRIVSQILPGVGFIGAGLMIFNGTKVSGVTTAAGIWVSAGVGMAIGYGFYMLAIAATLFSIFAFTVLWYLEKQIRMSGAYKEAEVE